MSTADVVVIGAGHHGLVAAVTAAEAGLDVVVLEQADVVGGALRSAQVTLPGFIHDLAATNVNLFMTSPFHLAHREELAGAGVSFAHASHPFASVFPDGRTLRISCDADETTRMWQEHSPADANGWLRTERLAASLGEAYGRVATRPMPSFAILGSLAAVVRGRRRTSPAELMRLVLSNARAFGDRYFATREAKALAAAWGMHLDYAPDIAGGAVFPVLEMHANRRAGMHLVRGGASVLSDALATMVTRRGGRVRTGCAAVGLETGATGAITGVRAESGECIRVRHGVISTVGVERSAEMLGAAAPGSFSRAAREFRHGPGTFMLHLATEGAVPWRDARLAPYAYVHAGGYVDDMARTYQQALAGVLPDRPLLVVGQSSIVDPTRSPRAGWHTVWVQVRMVPSRIVTDAGRDVGSGWEAVRDLFADRVMALLEHDAPGLSARVRARMTYTPDDLAAMDPVLSGGDSVAGSHHLDQLLGLRPSVQSARYATPVRGLYLAGAGTWPGAGVNAESGRLAARRLLRDTRIVRRVADRWRSS